MSSLGAGDWLIFEVWERRRFAATDLLMSTCGSVSAAWPPKNGRLSMRGIGAAGCRRLADFLAELRRRLAARDWLFDFGEQRCWPPVTC